MHNDRSIVPGCLSLGACAALLLLPAVAQTQAQSAEPPPVTIESQPDSPLHLTAAAAQWTEHQMLRLTVSLENVSTLPVRVYTVRYEPVSKGTSLGGGSLRSNLATPDEGVPYGQTHNIEFGEFGYDGPIAEIHVAVDFVESSDGSVWGPDRSESAQQLAGERAGGRRTLTFLRAVLDEQGTSAFPKALKAARSKLTGPEQHTAAWRQGYAGGVAAMCARVRHALKTGGLSDVEAALQRPYDASGE
jgi:hypothetical protein